MTKLQSLKQVLKELADNIRKTKLAYKECQRKHNGCDGYWEGEPGNGKWIGGYCSIIKKLKYEYRHKHVAYCLLRGRSRDEIECPAKDNQPNETYIQEIIHEYEDVYTCAS